MITKTQFIGQAVSELIQDNISVLLYNKEVLDGGYGGWFEAGDKDTMELVVAMKHRLGFEIFIHEYCHYLQWKENPALWETSEPIYDVLFDWINDAQEYDWNKKRRNYPEEELQKSLETIIKFEHDCERRVLQLADQLQIQDFDKTQYIKAVNSYLWSYHIAKELRLKSKNTIYTETVMKAMPDVFVEDVNYYLDKNNITSEMRTALLTEYQDGYEPIA